MQEECPRKTGEPDTIRTGHGFLAIVATPIGNLSDITLRAIETLKSSDLIAAEDTRRAMNLLRHFNISKPLKSYHSFNEHRITEQIIGEVIRGKNVSVVSDAGTPCISDPGFLIVREALRNGIAPLVIPGVSSLTYAVVAAGFPVDKFSFFGFLPVKPGRRKTILSRIAEEGRTAFLMESPHRMPRILQEIHDTIGPATEVAIIREATKVFEEVIRGKISEIIEKVSNRRWKGECILAICKDSKKEEGKTDDEKD